MLLTTPATSAVGLLTAAERLCPGFLAWEPETLWLELERQRVTLPETNRVKLMAAVALLTVPAFYWDGLVFEKTAIAFDHEVPNPQTLNEATAAQCSWAVREAAWILAQHGDANRSFMHEPGAYAAVILHREGFVLAPPQLDFAQGALDELTPKDGHALRDSVKAAWGSLHKSTMNVHVFEETPVDVQLARLAAVELHVQEREAQTSADLAKIR